MLLKKPPWPVVFLCLQFRHVGVRRIRGSFLLPHEKAQEAGHMNLDRKLQRALLEELRNFYPRKSSTAYRLAGYDQEDCIDNLMYLEEQGLVESGAIFSALSGSCTITQARITARGIDFLEDDGGVGAALAVVTVKLHEDTLRQLIEAKVQALNLPEEQRSGILKALREAPGETTKQLITKLVDLGMENAPRAIPLIQTLLQGGQP
ncbi:DUF2513 domain-containing protein [Pseudomonas alabamensis]|uniref:DUF2513 domain-containing protein n=1 Tax=Pseudomonas alabamensis TaxID=3064349 RepID=UPI0021D9B8F5|nr:DUF2513 domain-containing protein [Pseudomonas entomophila]